MDTYQVWIRRSGLWSLYGTTSNKQRAIELENLMIPSCTNTKLVKRTPESF